MDFPASPSVNDTYSFGGKTWVYNGTGWVLKPQVLFPVIIVTDATVAAVAGNHYVLTNAAQSTLTMPGAPTAGDTVLVTVANGRADNLIARNGHDIGGSSDATMTIDVANASIHLRYLDASRAWRIL